MEILAVGNAIVDVLTKVEDSFIDEQGIARGSMSLIDEHEAHALYRKLGPAVEASGGSAANTCAGIASFGGSVTFLGQVRDDQLGDVFAHDLRSQGVTFDSPPATTGPSTGRCYVMVSPDGERTMSTYLGIASQLGGLVIDPQLFVNAKITYVEGYLWDQPDTITTLKAVFAASKAAHTKTAFTLSDSFCVDRHRSEFLALLDDLDIVFANEQEVCALFETDDWDLATNKLAGLVSIAACTRGSSGSVLFVDGQRYDVPALRVEEIVDTTGAGDLYAAGVLYGLAAGLDPAVAGRLGSLAAAEVLGQLGARPQRSLRELAVAEGLLLLTNP